MSCTARERKKADEIIVTRRWKAKRESLERCEEGTCVDPCNVDVYREFTCIYVAVSSNTAQTALTYPRPCRGIFYRSTSNHKRTCYVGIMKKVEAVFEVHYPQNIAVHRLVD